MAREGTTDPHEQAGSSSEFSETLYATLRAMAQRQMKDERRDHTLTATALVHEAFLRIGSTDLSGDARRRYLAASQAIRRILIDHARKRKAEKRGGAMRRVALTDPALQ